MFKALAQLFDSDDNHRHVEDQRHVVVELGVENALGAQVRARNDPMVVLYRHEVTVQCSPAMAGRGGKSTLDRVAETSGVTESRGTARVDTSQHDIDVAIRSVVAERNRSPPEAEVANDNTLIEYDPRVVGNQILMLEAVVYVSDEQWDPERVFFEFDCSRVFARQSAHWTLGNADEIRERCAAHIERRPGDPLPEVKARCPLTTRSDIVGWCHTPTCGQQPDMLYLFQSPVDAGALAPFRAELSSQYGTHNHVRSTQEQNGDPLAVIELDKRSAFVSLATHYNQDATMLVDGRQYIENVREARELTLCNAPLVDLDHAVIRVKARHDGGPAAPRSITVVFVVKCLEFAK